jgi:hypothetical protein
MNDKEIKDFQRVIREYKKEVTKTTESAKKFLYDTGVLTKGGHLTRPYKNLCIPEKQG